MYSISGGEKEHTNVRHFRVLPVPTISFMISYRKKPKKSPFIIALFKNLEYFLING
jgi:hypothetical protein